MMEVQDEVKRTQDNMFSLKEELLSSEKKVQQLSELKVQNKRKINDLEVTERFLTEYIAYCERIRRKDQRA